MAIFVELNGHALEAMEHDVVGVMVAVADHRCTERELADWVRRHLVRIKAG